MHRLEAHQELSVCLNGCRPSVITSGSVFRLAMETLTSFLWVCSEFPCQIGDRAFAKCSDQSVSYEKSMLSSFNFLNKNLVYLLSFLFLWSYQVLCVCVCVSKWKRECQTNGKHHKRKSQAQWKEKYRTGRGPFRQSSHCHPDKRKRERLSTKPTQFTVYLFRDLNRDRSRLLWMTVGHKGQYSAKRRTRKRQSSKTFKRWSNLHRRRPLAVLRTSGVIVHLAPGASRRALGYVRSNFWHTHTLGTRTAETKRKRKKNQSSKKEGRKNNNKREEVRPNSPN